MTRTCGTGEFNKRIIAVNKRTNNFTFDKRCRKTSVAASGFLLAMVKITDKHSRKSISFWRTIFFLIVQRKYTKVKDRYFWVKAIIKSNLIIWIRLFTFRIWKLIFLSACYFSHHCVHWKGFRVEQFIDSGLTFERIPDESHAHIRGSRCLEGYVRRLLFLLLFLPQLRLRLLDVAARFRSPARGGVSSIFSASRGRGGVGRRRRRRVGCPSAF